MNFKLNLAEEFLKIDIKEDPCEVELAIFEKILDKNEISFLKKISLREYLIYCIKRFIKLGLISIENTKDLPIPCP